MEDHELDQLIAALKNKNQPQCPHSVESNVFRRLRLEENQDEDGLFTWFGLLVGRSGFAVAMLAVVVVMSATVSVASSSASLGEVDRQVESARALGFESITHPETLSFYTER